MTSIRQLAKQANVSHSSIVKILNGNYGADPQNIIKKLLGTIGGVHIPPEKYQDILEMLGECKFNGKFNKAQRTATWLWDLITNAESEKENTDEQESRT